MDSKILPYLNIGPGVRGAPRVVPSMDAASGITGLKGSEQRKELPGAGQLLPHNQSGKDVSEAQINGAVDSLRDYVQTIKRELEFSVDEDTGQRIIKVIDSETDTVIRQIPPEELLAIARYLDESSGVMLEVEA